MNGSSALPTIHLPIPKSIDLWEDMAYVPILSNIKGAIDIVVGVASLIASVVVGVFAAISFSLATIMSALERLVYYPDKDWKDFENWTSMRAALAFSPAFALAAIGGILLCRGIIESIPVAGNFALGYLDGRVRFLY